MLFGITSRAPIEMVCDANSVGKIRRKQVGYAVQKKL